MQGTDILNLKIDRPESTPISHFEKRSRSWLLLITKLINVAACLS